MAWAFGPPIPDTNPRSTLTIRLPDDKRARLRQLAKHRDISVNKLVEELATISIGCKEFAGKWTAQRVFIRTF